MPKFDHANRTIPGTGVCRPQGGGSALQLSLVVYSAVDSKVRESRQAQRAIDANIIIQFEIEVCRKSDGITLHDITGPPFPVDYFHPTKTSNRLFIKT